MFRLIVEKELRETLGTTKFAVTFAVCAVLILLAFYVGARNYQVGRAEYEAARAENLKQMEGLTDWGRVDHRIFMPPQPLAALVSGVANDIGRTTEVETRGELRSENSRFNEDPMFAVFRFLDLEFLFGVVLSLFAILFAYDAINGEKERGTLRLSFANSIPRDRYILGKLVGAFLALAIPLLIPILIGCVLLPILGVPMDNGAWLRLGLVVLAGYLYLGVFLALSVFISAMTERSATSFLMLLVVWIVAVLIVPRASVLVAGRAVDVPSIDRINFDKSKFETQLWQEDRDKMMDWQEENSREGESGREFFERFQQYTQELGEERNQRISEYTARLNEERRNRESVQQRVALGIARISPTAVFTLATTNLAGTSLSLKHQYQAESATYQKIYSDFIKEKTGRTNSGMVIRLGGEEEEELDPIDPYELPDFSFAGPQTADVTAAALPDLGLLVLFNVVFFAGAFVSFLKYDVR